MADSFDASKLEEWKAVLRKLIECVELVSIEGDACEKLALEKGATCLEVAAAKEAALVDPEIQRQIREVYLAMWKALEETGTEAFLEEILHSLPTHGKPN